jgi:Lipocalin-like domain
VSTLSALHLDLLARGVLHGGAILLGKAVTIATPWRLLVLAITMAIPSWLLGRRKRRPHSPPDEPVDPDRTLVFRRRGASLEGTWRLLAVEGRSDGRTISTPFGKDPVGHLVYMRDGRMSVMLMAAARKKFGSHGLRAGTGREKAAAFDSFLAYTGRYELLEDRVIHHPDVASIPDFVGVPEERFVSLEGDRLVLSTPPMLDGGKVRTFAIVWERVSPHPLTATQTVPIAPEGPRFRHAPSG